MARTNRTVVRWLFRVLCALVYRALVLGRGHVPREGGGLLVSNHISFLDIPLILGSAGRFVRFVLPADTCEVWWLKHILRYLRVIPLPTASQPREMIRALQQARDAIVAGELVGIFPEDNISRIGALLPFRKDFERIMEGVEAPIIPVCLDGLWGSVFTFEQGRFFWKVPRRLPSPVTITYGQPLPASTTAYQARFVIQELNTESWVYRRQGMRPLNRSFIRTARRRPFRFAMADARVPKLSFGGALMKTIFLARRLRSTWSGQEMVGILLPPSVAGALVNHAALLLGKVPVNLNYTLADEAMSSCVRQCQLETIVTSQTFLDKLKVKIPCRAVLLEEVAAKPGLGEKLSALLLAVGFPAGALERVLGRSRPGTLEDLATIIFSSGSTGDPKGVQLTQYNLASNAQQLNQLLSFTKKDRFVGILPFFHSFGFTATLAAPSVLGMGVVFHPNPLEAKPIGELVRKYSLTYLMATPTFLQIYLRSCEAADFGSLRCVMASAEKLPDWLANAFEEKFGLRPMEGYGCTECSPVVTCSTQDFRAAGFRQKGNRRGSVGRALPGVSLRIVDPDTGSPVPPGAAGLLLVRGPNVMLGYLGKPEKTAQVIRDGWYTTGDIAALDEDGLLTITDRLSRFSKIGGEMVPHVKVEEKLHEALGTSEIVFAVCGVPDEKKGERLVVLHTLKPEELDETLKKLPQLGLPNLWTPRANQFFRVESLPLLATGKRDLRALKELANRLAAQKHPDDKLEA